MRRPRRLVLLGHPVHHSLSPCFQNAALQAAGIKLEYVARDVLPAQLPALVDDIRRKRWAGNVTVPHKVRMAELCDTLTPVAREVGAVNTFWVDNDLVLHGDNTDVGGFHAAAQQLLGSLEGVRVGLIGAGGAAAAVVAAIQQWPRSRITLWNRTSGRANDLVLQFMNAPIAIEVVRDIRDVVDGANLIVNATTVGLHDEAMPLPIDMIPRNAAVLDLVYHVRETALVRAARDAGHRAMDGLAMLIEQGALAFERWLNKPADRDVMWNAVGRGRARIG